MLNRTLWVGLSVLTALNCGGNTDAGDGGNAGSAGSTGGSGASAGSGATGASGGSAGASGAGGSSGSAGAGGSGGSAGAGGSGGSAGAAGRGGSAGMAGSGGSSNFGACTLTSQCMVRPRSCCGDCGAATRSDAIAINRGNASGYTLEMCQDTGCPACYMPQDPTLVARCENGACQVVDLNELPLTACNTNTDCRVRVANCCECGGNVELGALIAIRNGAEPEYERLACDSPGPSCAECVPPYPQGAIAVCNSGRCTVSGFSGATPQSP